MMKKRKPAICSNCQRERIIRSRNLCSGCSSIVDRVPPRERKEALAAFKERLGLSEKIVVKNALRVEDFYRARTVKQIMREKYGEFFR